MPYLIYLVGILFGLYAFLRFFMGADTRQIRRFFLTVFLAAYAVILIEMAVTGRLILAIILLLALVPFVILYYHRKAKERKALPPPTKNKEDS